MNERNTKQKQLIMEVIKKDKTHPTIQQLCKKIQKENAHIGQATIYRNVNKLVDEGIIRRIATINDVDHYDGNISFHYHLICKKCGNIIDVFDDDWIKFIKKLEKEKQIEIEDSNILFTGICKSCKDEKVSL